jgi:hypothetical protein
MVRLMRVGMADYDYKQKGNLENAGKTVGMIMIQDNLVFHQEQTT